MPNIIMKKFLLNHSIVSTFLFICVIFINPIQSVEWSPIGPDSVRVLHYLSSFQGDLLCLDDGLLLHDPERNSWKKYSFNNMAVNQALDLYNGEMLLVMRNQSKSDGIYLFDTETHTFTVLEYMAEPRFIISVFPPGPNTKPIFFAGGRAGVFISTDTLNWDPHPYFAPHSDLNCLAIAYYGDHLVISEENDIFISEDRGVNFRKALAGQQLLTDLSFDHQGRLFAIYPDSSRSSGLWRSDDFGDHWSVETWSMNMQCVSFSYDYLFVGWERPYGKWKGVAVWDTLAKRFHFLNSSLPDVSVNRFSENTLIDCYNIVCCTDSGAYFTCDFPVTIKNRNNKPLKEFQLYQNYPNPFNPITTIQYVVRGNHDSPVQIDLSIYNILGQKVVTLVSKKQPAGTYQVRWDASEFTAGVYFYKMQTELGYIQTRKMVVLK